MVLVLKNKSGKKFTGFQVIAEEGSFFNLTAGIKKNTEYCEKNGRITHSNAVCIIDL